MNNEEKILDILLQMQQEQKTTNQRLAKLEAGQAKLQADVAEIKTNIKYLWDDVSRIGNRVDIHDEIIHRKIM